MEKKFNIVVGEDGTVKLPDAVLEKLEVKPGEEVRFEVDDNFYAVKLLSRIEAERLDYLNWMHNKHCPSIEEMIAESRKQATQNIVISRILDGMPAEKIAEGYVRPSNSPKRREQEKERLMQSRSRGSSQTSKAWNRVSAVQISRFFAVYLGKVA